MSALPRARSRSKTAPETEPGIAKSKGKSDPATGTVHSDGGVSHVYGDHMPSCPPFGVTARGVASIGSWPGRETRRGATTSTNIYHDAKSVANVRFLDTDTHETLSGDLTLSSPLSSSPQPTAPSAQLESDPSAAAINSASMLEVLSTAALQEPKFDTSNVMDTAVEDHPDNGSSSLSELGDASDDHSEPTPRPSVVPDPGDNDSEAETERLVNTPRKLTRTATNTSIASEHTFDRTPSKLAYSKTLEDDDSGPPTPSAVAEEVLAVDPTSGRAGLESLSILAISEAANLEAAGKKRKRSSLETSSADEPSEEPARKRSSTIRDTALNGSQDASIDAPEQVDVEEELDNAEERISQLAQEDAELEERQADVALEAVSELATVANLSKPRRGGRKGKRKANNTASALAEAVAPAEDDVEGEGDNDEEDSAALDEGGKLFLGRASRTSANRSCAAAKKKSAIDELAKIERKFKIFREKWVC
jgi:hypothetical protein